MPDVEKGGPAAMGNSIAPGLAYVDEGLLDRVRRILSARRSRADFFPMEIFGEPAWDVLLDLYLAFHENKRISVSSACIASGVPATTALRWLRRMEVLGLIERVNDRDDGRRVYVAMTSHGCRALNCWLRQGPER